MPLEDIEFGGDYGGWEPEIESWASDSWLSDDDVDDFDFGDTFSTVGSYLVEGAENLFEWGAKNPQAVLGGVIGAGKSVMDYYSKSDAGPSTAEYYRERNLRHDQGMRDYVKSFNKEE